MNSAATPVRRIPFSVPGDHPCIAGHFPGHPVVPAVVLLEQVDRAVAASGWRLVGLLSAKFEAVVRPDEPLALEVSVQPDGVGRFVISRASQVVATGTVRCVRLAGIAPRRATGGGGE